MPYRDALHFLVAATEVVELYNDYGGRVAVCPAWGGRVMTSTCDGLDGDSFGLIPVATIEQWGKQCKAASSFFGEIGGEDRLLISCCSVDDGGVMDGAFSLLPHPAAGSPLILQRHIVANHNSAPLELDIDRRIRLLACSDLAATFGQRLCAILDRGDASFVAFESASTVTYRGISPHDARVSLRLEGAFNASDHTIATMPFRRTHESRHGIRVDYFGLAPHRRLRWVDHTVCMRADGRRRCQAGATYIAALPIVGTIDFRNGTLTLIHYTLPPVGTEPFYHALEPPCETDKSSDDSSGTYALNNGDVVRVTNGGDGLSLELPFYTWDTCSPAITIEPKMSLTHIQQTVHIVADRELLSELTTLYLGCDAEALFAAMFS